MSRLRVIALVSLTMCSSLSHAAGAQAWPWGLFGPSIEYCAQFEPMRDRLLKGISRASESTKNLLPARMWRAYRESIKSVGGGRSASSEERAVCETLIERLEAPDLSARVRGEMFLGLMQRAPFDCILDDPEKGKHFLIELKNFYARNGLVYPEQAVKKQLAEMRAKNVRVLNGWGTPHCANFQRSLSTGELDQSVSEQVMREQWFSK